MSQDSNDPKLQPADSQPEEERNDKNFSRRALIQAGWAIPVVIAAQMPKNAMASSPSHGDHADTPHNDTPHNDAPQCRYSISPTMRTVTSPCSPTTGTVFVTATAGCGWSVVVDLGTFPGLRWLKIVSGGGPNVGTGAPQPVVYSTASNRHQDSRSGTLTVLDDTGAFTSAVATINQGHGHACP